MRLSARGAARSQAGNVLVAFLILALLVIGIVLFMAAAMPKTRVVEIQAPAPRPAPSQPQSTAPASVQTQPQAAATAPVPAAEASAGSAAGVARPAAPASDPVNAVLIIETPGGRGSGFFIKRDDGYWMVSNTHVVGTAPSAKTLKAYDQKGNPVPFTGAVKVDLLGDLVLVKVADGYNVERYLVEGPEPVNGDAVTALGNAGGVGVVSTLPGVVQGKGAHLGVAILEISCQIVPGCSGGPVINSKGEFVGISTYLVLPMHFNEQVFKGTPLEKTRQMAVRSTRLANTQDGKISDLFLYNRASSDRCAVLGVLIAASHGDRSQAAQFEFAVQEMLRKADEPLLEKPVYGFRRSGMREEYYAALRMLAENPVGVFEPVRRFLDLMKTRMPCTAFNAPIHNAIDEMLRQAHDGMATAATKAGVDNYKVNTSLIGGQSGKGLGK